jgi:Mg-chelatase subunit ChlD
MDVVFVVDASGSVGPIDYLIILNFVSRVVGMLDVDSGLVRVGLLMFGSESRVVFNLNRYSSVLDIQAALAQVRYVGGSTMTAPALRAARDWMFQSANGSRDGARHVIVLITDGNTADTNNATNEVRGRCLFVCFSPVTLHAC